MRPSPSLIALGLMISRSCATFTYNESNPYYYSYPSNFTHVPCDSTRYGEAACIKLTGNLRTTCFPTYNNASSSLSSSVCGCYVGWGMTPSNRPGCSSRDIRPECISGSNACEGRNAPFLVLFFAGLGLVLLLAAVILAQGFFSLLRIYATATSLNAQVTVNVFITGWAVAYNVMFFSMVKAVFGFSMALYFSVGIPAVGFMGIFTIAAICNVCMLWIKVVTYSERMQMTSSSNLNASEFLWIWVFGLVASLSIIVLMFADKIQLMSSLTVVYEVALAVYVHYGGKRFVRMLSKFKEPGIVKTRKSVHRTATRVSAYLGISLLGSLTYGIVPRNPNKILNFYIRSIGMSILFFFLGLVHLEILRYMKDSYKQKIARVASMNAHDTIVTMTDA